MPTIRELTLQALRNAEENGYGGGLREKPIAEVVLDLLEYDSELEGIGDFESINEIYQAVKDWKEGKDGHKPK